MNVKAEIRDPEGAFPRLSNIGLSGMLVTFADELSEPANRAALAFQARLEVESWVGVEETATSLTSVYIGFDPTHMPHSEMVANLHTLLADTDWYGAALPQKRKLWRIPAVFGGASGPQLAHIATQMNLSPKDAIKQLASERLRVLTIGFAPGQPYLGQLPPQWDIPRQSGLTPKVTAGALAVAIRQVTMFTTETPTGWAHIGQTEFRGFRPDSNTPFVLRPGDEVSFCPVPEETLANIRAGNAHGDGGARWDVLK